MTFDKNLKTKENTQTIESQYVNYQISNRSIERTTITHQSSAIIIIHNSRN